MNEKLPPQLAEFIAPLWVWVLGALGAAVGYLEDFKPDDTASVKTLKAVTRLSSSALAAVLTYSAIKAIGIPEAWHVVLIGIAGHMGVEALRAFGEVWKSRMGAK